MSTRREAIERENRWMWIHLIAIREYSSSLLGWPVDAAEKQRHIHKEAVIALTTPAARVGDEPDPKDMPVTRPWKDASPDFQAGYRAGWADREADILCGIDRIKPAEPSPASTLLNVIEQLEADTSTFEHWCEIEQERRDGHAGSPVVEDPILSCVRCKSGVMNRNPGGAIICVDCGYVEPGP